MELNQQLGSFADLLVSDDNDIDDQNDTVEIVDLNTQKYNLDNNHNNNRFIRNRYSLEPDMILGWKPNQSKKKYLAIPLSHSVKWIEFIKKSLNQQSKTVYQGFRS